jgi:hypothetical protein
MHLGTHDLLHLLYSHFKKLALIKLCIWNPKVASIKVRYLLSVILKEFALPLQEDDLFSSQWSDA